MSLIHGSRGLIYFVHQFEPTFKEASLLDDEELLPAVTAINRQIHDLAPVLNSPTITDDAKLTGSDAESHIAVMCKNHEGALYVFTVNMRNRAATGSVEITKPMGDGKAHVIGEDRSIEIRDGRFEAGYEPYGVRLYRIDQDS